MIKRLGIGWHVGVPSGWGTYGVNLSLQLAQRGIVPAIFLASDKITLTEPQGAILKDALAENPHWRGLLKEDAPTVDFPFLHALGNDLSGAGITTKVKGRPDIALVFFEHAIIPQAHLEEANRYALIIAGSSWNAEALRRQGIAQVANCLQGVDLDLFKPGPRTGRFRGRFTVFSGGKLEYRKGQDLVVAAFKRFHAKHKDALLVTAWHNPWPAVAKGLSLSTHIAGVPGVDRAGKLDVAKWLRENGLPSTAFFDIGPQSNAIMPVMLREMDLAVFPNRAEGGTNLVAMECMATGVPTVLSRNTGHLDLITPENCYSLDLQIPMGEVTGRADYTDWGESSIEELVLKMEQAYTDRADAAVRGAAAAAFMQDWNWSAQTDKFLAAIAPVI